MSGSRALGRQGVHAGTHADTGLAASRKSTETTLEVAGVGQGAQSHRAFGWAWWCPECRRPVVWSASEARCDGCGRMYIVEHEIWRFLPASRAGHFVEFGRRYRIVRDDEGWGRGEAAYYRALPFVPDSDRQADIWRRRAQSYQRLIDRVVAPLEAAERRRLTIVDLGAGNCWLSARLIARGHQVAAVDLSDHPLDGLGAYARYGDGTSESVATFVPIQSDFDRLPFVGEQADLVVYNGALHYSTDFATTLREALRVARPDGRIVIIDTPVYGEASSGARMVAERDRQFRRRYGFAGDALPHEHFLTSRRLRDLAEQLEVTMTIIGSEPMVRGLLRRSRARVRGHRTPAAFPIVVLQPRTCAIGIEVSKLHSSSTSPPTSNSTLRGGSAWHSLRKLRGNLAVVVRELFPRPWYWALRRVVAAVHIITKKGTSPHTSDGAVSRRHQQVPSAGPLLPRLRGLRQTRRLWRVLRRLTYWLTQRHRHGRYVAEHVAGRPIVVFPTVFNPKLLRTGEFLARTLDRRLIPPGSTVLDMGTGTGVGAIVAARRAGRVVAVDINADAVRCAKTNAVLNRVDDRVEVRHGDLFDPVAGERFDVIIFNPPFFRGVPRDGWEQAWRSTDVVERFASGLAEHLSAEGVAYVVLSTDGDLASFLAAFEAAGLDIKVASERDLGNEILVVYQLRPCAASG